MSPPHARYLELYTLHRIDGKPLRELAERFDLTPRRIQAIVRRVDVWLASKAICLIASDGAAADRRGVHRLHLARLERQYARCMESFEASCRGDDGEFRPGNLTYLKEARAVMSEIRELLDSEAEAPTHPGDANHVAALGPHERAAFLDRVLETIRQSAGPASADRSGDGPAPRADAA